MELPLSVAITAPASAPYPDCSPGGPIPCVLSRSAATMMSVSVSASNASGSPGGYPGATDFVQNSPCWGQTICSGIAKYYTSGMFATGHLLVKASYQYGQVATGPLTTAPLIGTDSYLITLGAVPPVPKEPSIAVELSPVATASATRTSELTLTLRNTSEGEDLKQVKLDYPHGFGVANEYYPLGQRGEIQVVSGPSPAFPTELAAGASSVHTITVLAVEAGRVGLKAAVSARGVKADQVVSDTHYGEVEVAQQALEAERTAAVASGIALFLGNANRELRQQQARYARSLFNALKSRMSSKARRFYFGSTNKLQVTELERALARWRGQTPEFTALVTPNKQKLYKGGSAYLTEEQFARYQQLEQIEFEKLATAFMGKKWKDLMYEWRYWTQGASEEGRGRIAADLARWREANKLDGDALISALWMSLDPQATAQAMDRADAALQKQFAKVVDGLLKAREARVANLAKLAETDPDKFIGQLAKDDAKLHNEAFKTLVDQLIGDVQDRLQGKLFDGLKGGFAWLANGAKLTSNKEANALARSTAIGERTATLGPTYLNELSDEAKSMLDLRKMEAIGGMPVEDIEITKEIVAGVNARLKQLGHDVEAELLFRPANPYKVPGSFAKVETVGVKNIAPIDLALGAPPSLLAETAVFKPTDPTKLPGFKDFPEPERILLSQRYKDRLSEYNQFHGHVPVTDKKMKAMLKAFDKVQTFDVGKGRTIKMKLAKEQVGDATVFKYDRLEVRGRVVIDGKGKPRSIGTDYDGAVIIDKNTRQPLKGQVLSAAEFEWNRLGEKAAIDKNYANPFHGFTAHGSDVDAADYPFFAHFWLVHLNEAQALREAQRLAANYNRGKPTGQHVTAAKLLSKAAGVFERHLLKVSASEASFGPANVVFRTPVVAP